MNLASKSSLSNSKPRSWKGSPLVLLLPHLVVVLMVAADASPVVLAMLDQLPLKLGVAARVCAPLGVGLLIIFTTLLYLAPALQRPMEESHRINFRMVSLVIWM
jgi:hypothetical protein